VNLGTARILIVVALVVAGIAVLANAFGQGTTAAFTPAGGGGSPAPSTSASPSASASHSPKPLPSPATTGIHVSVFSGINTPGCAGTVNTMLTADGYVAADPPSDATHKPIPKSAVYFRPDPGHHNQSDAIYMAAHYFDHAKVAKLTSTFPGVVSPQAQAVVLIGNDYTSKC
jgi:LytR cell envelope-related transcriptional attenuator